MNYLLAVQNRKFTKTVVTGLLLALVVSTVGAVSAFNTPADYPQNVEWNWVKNAGTNCVNATGTDLYEWEVAITNHGPGTMDILYGAFQDDEAGCGATTRHPNPSRLQISGKNTFNEGESGNFKIAYDATNMDCGRVQVDASFREKIDNGREDTSLFLGMVINFGQNCGGETTEGNQEGDVQGKPEIVKTVRNITAHQNEFVNETEANPGDVVEFKLAVKAKDGKVNNARVHDDLPERLSLVSGSVYRGDTKLSDSLEINLGDFNKDQVRNITFKAKVAEANRFGDGRTGLENIAKVQSNNGEDRDEAHVVVRREVRQEITPTPTPTPTPTQQNGKIKIEKHVRRANTNENYANSVTVQPGAEVEFLLEVITTDGRVTDAYIRDQFPSRLHFVSGSIRVGNDVRPDDLSKIHLGTIEAGHVNQRQVTFRARVAQSNEFADGSTTLTNVGVAKSNQGDDDDDAHVIVSKQSTIPNIKIGFDKKARNVSDGQSQFSDVIYADANETIEFELSLNVFQGTLNNVVVWDQLPERLNLVPGTIRVNNDARPNNLGHIEVASVLSAGSLRTITFRATVSDTSTFSFGETTLVNTATVTHTDGSVTDYAWVKVQRQGNVNLVLSKLAFNTSKGKDATRQAADKGDYIDYVLTVENRGNTPALGFVIEDNIADVLELADLVNSVGATLDANKVLRWPGMTIPAGSKVQKSFTVRVKTAFVSESDFVMSNVYGNMVNVHVRKIPYEAPPTGNTTSISLSLALLMAASFAFVRQSGISFKLKGVK